MVCAPARGVARCLARQLMMLVIKAAGQIGLDVERLGMKRAEGGSKLARVKRVRDLAK